MMVEAVRISMSELTFVRYSTKPSILDSSQLLIPEQIVESEHELVLLLSSSWVWVVDSELEFGFASWRGRSGPFDETGRQS